MNAPHTSKAAAVPEIAAELCAFLGNNILAPGIAIQPDSELSPLGVDSYSLMELILFIERRYGLVMAPETLTPENLHSVNSLSACCAMQLQQGND
jgi:acyl carrier protein